jgi:glycosyltransferase involved in cell wall biosynthesis
MSPDTDAAARVSYIISTRNRAAFLAKTLDNVREFITPVDELIIVDGGSVDNTAAVVSKHLDIVRFFTSEPDRGEAHALNKAVLQSRGRYIKIITDDDYTYPDAMNYAIQRLEQDNSIDALVCGGESYVAESKTQEPHLWRYIYLPQELDLKLNDFTVVFDYLSCGLGLIIRRRVVALLGLFDTTFRALDTDYLTRLLRSSASVRYLDVKLYRHTEYGHSSQRHWQQCFDDRLRILLRNGAWDDFITAAGDSKTTARILGISTQPTGLALAGLLRSITQMRRNKLLWPILLMGRAGRVPGALVRRIAGKRRATSPNGPHPSTTEPQWTGQIR